MYKDRQDFYTELEKELNTKVIVYVTSDRPGMETQIASDVIDCFINQLDKIGVVQKITLYLYTCGGDTAAAWNIINLIKMYCEELDVIIPQKALSAGTLISLGANRIIMTKQAVLGSIDPSLQTPLNPKIDGNLNYPVSVEAVKEYLGIAKKELEISNDEALSNILIKLSDNVHPLVLGQVFRTRNQIKMLAMKLLSAQISDDKKKEHAINFLCSDSGSHDYTINRREAKNELGLNIINPTDHQYAIIKNIYDDIVNELEMRTVFNPNRYDKFLIKRGIVESLYESDMFITEGEMKPQINVQGITTKNPVVYYEGWRKSND